ncbi:MAG: hypothetical protein ACRCWI_06135 [Brevinema sp.]
MAKEFIKTMRTFADKLNNTIQNTEKNIACDLHDSHNKNNPTFSDAQVEDMIKNKVYTISKGDMLERLVRRFRNTFPSVAKLSQSSLEDLIFKVNATAFDGKKDRLLIGKPIKLDFVVKARKDYPKGRKDPCIIIFDQEDKLLNAINPNLFWQNIKINLPDLPKMSEIFKKLQTELNNPQKREKKLFVPPENISTVASNWSREWKQWRIFGTKIPPLKAQKTFSKNIGLYPMNT